MNQKVIERVIDVRPIPPRQKHPTIFDAWNGLETGGSLLLINDHDPVPLYYQFACENQGGFRWDYLEQGPAIWRVRISKGAFADPGFVPAKKPKAEHHHCCCSAPIGAEEPLVLDTRPIFGRGETPCGAIDDAVASLAPGQPFVLLVPFEPAPLYTKLGREGFSHKSAPLEDGGWRVEFKKS